MLRDAGFDMDLDGVRQLQHPVPERQQLGAGDRRVHAGRARRRRLDAVRRHRRLGRSAPCRARELWREIAQAAWECADPGPAVRHDDQPVAHGPRHGPDQRLEPVQRVHAPRQLGVQPGLDQPAQVPRRATTASTSRASSHTVEVVFTAQEILVGRADYPTEQIGETTRRVPPARPRLRQPRRAADGARPALRLARGSGVGRGDHLADDRPRLRHQRPHGQPDGSVRRVRRERGAHARRAAHAPRRGVRDRRRRRGPGRTARRRPGGVGRRGARRRGVRRPQQPGHACSPRPARSRSCSTATPPASSPTSAWSSSRSSSAAATSRSSTRRSRGRCAASATAPQQVDEIVAYIDAEKSDPRRPAPRRRARRRVRLQHGRQHDPLRGPRADDGRGAAVHLRGDLARR